VISAYLDASVILRILLEEEAPLQEWSDLEIGVSSQIVTVECHRALERLWREHKLDDNEYALKLSKVKTILGYLELIAVDESVIARASQPFPTRLATLDALHLATAILYRENQPGDVRPLLLATHDHAFARAAREMRFDVVGSPE